MADIPDQPVIRRIEDVMQRDRELDHAKARAKMPAGDRDGIDHLRAQLVSHLPELVRREAAEIGGKLDLVEQGRGGRWFMTLI